VTNLKLPEPKRSAKAFLLRLTPQVLELFDVPKNILVFNVHEILSKQIYSMSEESAAAKLTALKRLVEQW
jgi:hypothetical protein